MEGVDLKDQAWEPCKFCRNGSKKWCIKLFRRLLNISEHTTCVSLRRKPGQYRDVQFAAGQLGKKLNDSLL
jgi:hypothetical protein